MKYKLMAFALFSVSALLMFGAGMTSGYLICMLDHRLLWK